MNEPSTQLEFLTPAWIGGASPSAAAEVRVATIRGHLRQWLRILHPNAAYDDAIFGRIAGEGRNARASSSCVALRLVKAVGSSQALDLPAYERLNRNTSRDENYFLWSLASKPRGVLLPGASSEFTLSVRWFPTPASRNQTLRPIFASALRAFILLGCMGTRATRGYGSVWEKGKDLADAAQLRQELSFLPECVSVRLLDGEFDDGRTALAAAARWMRSYRVGSRNFGTTTDEAVIDHDVADPDRPARQNAVVYRQALGLPLAQRFRRDRETHVIQSKYREHPNAAENERYPSPMRIKVIRMGGKFRVLVVLLRLPAFLLPEGTRISLNNRPPRIAELSHQLLNRMMQSGTQVH